MTTTILNVDDSSTNFLIPNGNLILVADYEQVGDDLVLSGPDGTTVTVQGYFSLSNPPDLVSTDGAVVPSDIVISMAEAMSSLPEGGLGAPIGQVVLLEGGATATLAGGVVVTLVEGDSVFQDSLIETDEEGVLGLVLSDGTAINLSQNGRLLLDEFVFDPETSLGVSALTVLQGVMATQTGEIGKNDPESVSIRALVGTIGIRGTTLVVEVDELGTVEITLVDGAIVVKMPDGHEYTLNDSGEFLVVSPSGDTSIYDGGNERIDQLLEDVQFQGSLDKIRAILEEQKRSDGDDANNGTSGSANGADGDSDQQSSPDGSNTSTIADPPAGDPSGAGSSGGGASSGGSDSSDSNGNSSPGSDGNQLSGPTNAAPEFPAESYTFSVEENADGNVESVNIGTVVAEDADADSVLTYSIINGNYEGLFRIDAGTGAITYIGTGEDFEGHEGFELTVQASDGSLSTQTTVTIDVADVNEVPAFSGEEYSFTISENGDGSGTAIAVGSVSATDPDADNTMVYSIVSGNEDGLFAIDAETGAITYVGTGENFEGHEGFELTVQASDGSLSTQTAITVKVADIDEKPTFSSDSYTFTLAENGDGNTASIALGVVSATDPDIDSTVRYTIVSGNDAGLFEIDAETGAITYVGTGENFEGHGDFELTVRASDGNLSTQATVTVTVTDVNEVPEFSSDSYSFTLAENGDGSTAAIALGTVSATDPDIDSTVRYMIVSGNDAGLFEINAETGAITYVGSGENFEGHGNFELTVQASDGSLSAQTTVTVTVSDVNEAPEFSSDSYAFTLTENTDGSDNAIAIGGVSATDPDADNTVNYSIVSGNDGGLFKIDVETGAITYVGSGENFEGHGNFELTVQASDGTLSTQVTVTVAVADVNEAPAFSSDSYSFTLAENEDGSSTAIAVGSVSATDPDTNSTMRYSIVSGNDAGLFEIDAETGAITYVGGSENFEAGNADFTLTVQASDGSLSTQATVAVKVTDVNEAPEFVSDSYSFTLPENADGREDGVSVGRVSATDPDAGSTVRYSIVSGNDSGRFEINANTGAITYVGSGENFGHHPGFTLTVQASDGSLSTRTTVKVKVTDVNEPPEFSSDSYTFTLAENGDGREDGVSVGRVSATDPDTDSTVRYSIMSGNDAGLFEINAETGAITYVGSGENFEADNANFKLTVQASDGSLSARTTVTVKVTNVNERPEFVSDSYSFTLPENADGRDHGIPVGKVSARDPDADSTLRYSIVSGNDSGRFEINAKTGTITYVGSGENFGHHPGFTLTVQASDGSLSTRTTVTVRVTDVNEAPNFSSDNYLFTLAENEDGSSTAVVLGTVSARDPDGDAVRYTIISGNNAGLFEINASTGVITYVGAGEDFESSDTVFTLTVRASDGSLSTQTAVTINITDVDDTGTPVFPNDNYSFDLAENRDGSNTAVGVGTVSATDPESDTLMYSIVSGNDAGLFAINANTGVITYVGTGEDFESSNTSFTLTVQASDGSLSSRTIVRVSVTNVNEVPAFPNNNYSFDLAENGDGSNTAVGVGAVSATDPEGDTLMYSIVSGNTAGLFAINASTGVITYVGTGEDFESSNTSFTLTVQASDGSLSSQTTVTVNVANVNEAPGFADDSYAFELSGNADGSMTPVAVGTVSATDPDAGDSVTYSIKSETNSNLFAINSSGEIRFTGNNSDINGLIDISLTIIASDGSIETEVAVTVEIGDVTNIILSTNEPRDFIPSPSEESGIEDSEPGKQPVEAKSVVADADSAGQGPGEHSSTVSLYSMAGATVDDGTSAHAAYQPDFLSTTKNTPDFSSFDDFSVNESETSTPLQDKGASIEDREREDQSTEVEKSALSSTDQGPEEGYRTHSSSDAITLPFDDVRMNDPEIDIPLPDPGEPRVEESVPLRQPVDLVESVIFDGSGLAPGEGYSLVANPFSEVVASEHTVEIGM